MQTMTVWKRIHLNELLDEFERKHIRLGNADVLIQNQDKFLAYSEGITFDKESMGAVLGCDEEDLESFELPKKTVLARNQETGSLGVLYTDTDIPETAAAPSMIGVLTGREMVVSSSELTLDPISDPHTALSGRSTTCYTPANDWLTFNPLDALSHQQQRLLRTFPGKSKAYWRSTENSACYQAKPETPQADLRVPLPVHCPPQPRGLPLQPVGDRVNGFDFLYPIYYIFQPHVDASPPHYMYATPATYSDMFKYRLGTQPREAFAFQSAYKGGAQKQAGGVVRDNFSAATSRQSRAFVIFKARRFVLPWHPDSGSPGRSYRLQKKMDETRLLLDGRVLVSELTFMRDSTSSHHEPNCRLCLMYLHAKAPTLVCVSIPGKAIRNGEEIICDYEDLFGCAWRQLVCQEKQGSITIPYDFFEEVRQKLFEGSGV